MGRNSWLFMCQVESFERSPRSRKLGSQYFHILLANTGDIATTITNEKKDWGSCYFSHCLLVCGPSHGYSISLTPGSAIVASAIGMVYRVSLWKSKDVTWNSFILQICE